MKAACLLAILAASFLLAGCERTFRDMYDQPKRGPMQPSPLFDNGMSSRPPPAGAVPLASGETAGSSSGRRGAEAVQAMNRAEQQQALPTPLPPALVQRGRERYAVYCMPCHSPLGDGDGRVVQRGFPSPPSFHIERLRQAPDRHFYDVMSQGYGVMYPYGDRIEPQDRWAIVAWIRALQLSQHAPAADLPQALQERLSALPATPREQAKGAPQ